NGSPSLITAQPGGLTSVWQRGTVPEVVRTAFFGHNAITSRAHYTDLTDTSAMVAAARQLRTA
ncbi:hypothetical protein, partial [Nesterenkonia salmonea]|uniref:hypothetical protein n=1 Tax=Nesterenkonia salmonea TaxID=1804987 RepID=UPI001AA05B74